MRQPPDHLKALVERYDPKVFDAPTGRARIRLSVAGNGDWDVVVRGRKAELRESSPRADPDAQLVADASTWRRIAADVRGGMAAFEQGRLVIRKDLHLGVGLLAATSGMTDEGRLRFARVKTNKGRICTASAGQGDPPVLLIHGLGGTKASFLPTVAALAADHRVIALDLPGFGDSDKPLAAPYDAPWFARSVVGLMDALKIERAHVIGNSMGGRVALELGMSYPERVDKLVLVTPSLAWMRERSWAPLLRFVRPELGLLQLAPRRVVEGVVRRLVPGARDGWAAAGVDEFLRAYLTPRGRAAFYAAARNIYLEEPDGETGFWTRLAGLEPEALFIWGHRDTLVPIGFKRHVSEAVPHAKHAELDCGHVPQVERPRETHAAIKRFFADTRRDSASGPGRARGSGARRRGSSRSIRG
ncbi:MAG TPA: alpha/beta fold hydrolase [Thermoleophilaceae bacterium]